MHQIDPCSAVKTIKYPGHGPLSTDLGSALIVESKRASPAFLFS
jgi:hypothetical protein